MGSHTLTGPQFDGSHQLGIFLVSSGLPWKAWEACTTAYKTPKPFVVREVEDVVFFAFPSFELTVRDFMLSGSTESADLFTHLKDNNDEPALIHRPFLSRFLHVLNNSDFQDKVELAQNKRQSIVFTGHSVGGAVAALATLWVLGKQQRGNLPFCVTFGCPLLGDEKLAQAVRREKWCGQFCHTVSQHDIIPRIFLAAPTLDQSLIHSPLKAFLPYWCSSMTNCPPNEVPLSNDQISIFFTNVVKQISGIVKYVSMATTNTLIDGAEPNDALINGIENFVPYRPFGSYLFCSENGAAYIENTVAVLQMLYFTMQATHKSPDPIAKACILEHIGYGRTLAHIMRNLVNVGEPSRGNIVLVDKDPYEVGIEMALEAAGIGIQQAPARQALIAAGKIDIRPSMNSAKQAVQLAKIQGARVEIEWYKLSCERDELGYYDSFKIQEDQIKDNRANLNRLKLEGFWDEIVNMVEKHELPDDFQCRYKWINASTTYRQLVEPLDIADYYRKGKHKVFGHYLDIGNEHGRPSRYKVLEKWSEDFQRKQGQRVIRTRLASLTQDSCFWARLEEAREWLNTFKENQDAVLLDKMHQFALHVQNLIDCRDVSCDVLLEKGSFIKWWKEYTEVQRALLPSSSVMDCEMQRLSVKP